MGKIVNVIVLILGVAMIAYWLLLGICVRFGQSLMFLWPLMGGLCIARYFYWRHVYAAGVYPPSAPVTVLRILFGALLLVFLAVEVCIAAGGAVTPPENTDYIIVLGARVNPDGPSGSLRNRIETAREYLSAHPDTKAVLSGGRGADEPMSEAQCMFEHLTAGGIDPGRLMIEDQSRDTAENLRNSYALIGDENASVAVVTNDFHMLRARALARGQGHAVGGVPVPTSAISYPHYMLREFAGVCYETVRGNLKFR